MESRVCDQSGRNDLDEQKRFRMKVPKKPKDRLDADKDAAKAKKLRRAVDTYMAKRGVLGPVVVVVIGRWTALVD